MSISASNPSSTNPAFIEAEVESSYILRTLKEKPFPNTFYRNVTDFQHGDQLNIKTIGSVTIQEVTENEDITFNPIESGTITLSVNNYIGDGYYITDPMRQDAHQIQALLQARAEEASVAIRETMETRFFNTLQAGQTASNNNAVNGMPRRFRGAGSNDTMAISDLINMQLAFNKANVPMGGRIAIVDPVVAATFSLASTLTSNLDASDPTMVKLVKDGFMEDHEFVTSLYGWKIFTSNKLPVISGETLAEFDASGSGSTSGVCNLFMSVASDQLKPGMMAMRQPPKVETERNITKQRDHFVETVRWADGVQRLDTLGVVVTSATATS
jgi:hypothetical protein